MLVSQMFLDFLKFLWLDIRRNERFLTIAALLVLMSLKYSKNTLYRIVNCSKAFHSCISREIMFMMLFHMQGGCCVLNDEGGISDCILLSMHRSDLIVQINKGDKQIPKDIRSSSLW